MELEAEGALVEYENPVVDAKDAAISRNETGKK